MFLCRVLVIVSEWCGYYHSMLFNLINVVLPSSSNYKVFILDQPGSCFEGNFYRHRLPTM